MRRIATVSVSEHYIRAAKTVTGNLGLSEWRDEFRFKKVLDAATPEHIRDAGYRGILEGSSLHTRRPLPVAHETTLANTAENA